MTPRHLLIPLGIALLAHVVAPFTSVSVALGADVEQVEKHGDGAPGQSSNGLLDELRLSGRFNLDEPRGTLNLANKPEA